MATGSITFLVGIGTFTLSLTGLLAAPYLQSLPGRPIEDVDAQAAATRISHALDLADLWHDPAQLETPGYEWRLEVVAIPRAIPTSGAPGTDSPASDPSLTQRDHPSLHMSDLCENPLEPITALANVTCPAGERPTLSADGGDAESAPPLAPWGPAVPQGRPVGAWTQIIHHHGVDYRVTLLAWSNAQ